MSWQGDDTSAGPLRLPANSVGCVLKMRSGAVPAWRYNAQNERAIFAGPRGSGFFYALGEAPYGENPTVRDLQGRNRP